MNDKYLARFHTKYRIESTSGCWMWTASLKPDGYGRFNEHGRYISAHRFAYERLVGPIPTGLVIDHLCRNRACVNPAHLEPVTQAENLRRGTLWNGNQTHCLRGHVFDATNTHINVSGSRDCRRCRALRQAGYRSAARQSEAA